jgi:ABC-type lipoprotein export system ATPase subunit
MKIELLGVVPLPMHDVQFSSAGIWNNFAVFETGNNYLITAPSGSGKTSLLSFIYGIRKDYKGDIFFNGKKISDFKLNNWAEIRRDKISLVFQDMRLIPDLTAGENLLLKNSLTNHKNEKDIKEMMDYLGLHDKWNQKCKTLSLGQQQRVAIIRALLQPFNFLLLDEPFSHIDTDNIKKATALINTTCKRTGANIIMMSLNDKYLFNYDKTYSL